MGVVAAARRAFVPRVRNSTWAYRQTLEGFLRSLPARVDG